jgi:mono/diheme cytochrome c family protein
MRHWFALIIGTVATITQASPVHFERLSADPVVHGKRLATVLGCNGCHGATMTGEDWSEPGFAKIWTSNLTRAAPRYTDAQLARAITGGVRFDGSALWEMPSHLFTQLKPDDITAIIAHVRSTSVAGVEHPRPVLENGAKDEIAKGLYRSSRDEVARVGRVSPPDVGPEFARGRAIARATCAECHGLDLRGGLPYPGAAARPDLRIAAGYDAAQFKTLLETGIAVGGRDVGLMGQVARSRYKHLTDGERAALLGYLHKVAEVAP